MSNYRMKSRSRLLCRSVEPLFLLLRTQEFLCCNIVVNLVLFSMFSVCCGYKEQKFAMEPQDQTAVIGSRVTLPCRVENKAGQLQWTKDDFGLGLHRDLSGYDRYKMIGSDEEGDYSLDIRDVTLEDDAKYQCQVSSGAKVISQLDDTELIQLEDLGLAQSDLLSSSFLDLDTFINSGFIPVIQVMQRYFSTSVHNQGRGEPPIRSRYAHLTILVPPENPKITQGNLLSTHEDTKVVLECISVGGKPPAEITWVDGNAGVLTQGVSYTVQQLSDGQRFTAKSVLKFSPKEEHHNQTFTCQAQNTADRAYRSASILLHVKYSPKIKIVKKGKMIKGKIAEGENVTLECTAHANPSNMTFKWFLNDRFVVADKIMVIENVSREHHGATVKCEVNNEIGKSEETSTLAITYPPKFRSNPQDVEADAGTSTILSCDVDSYPEPNIEWTHLDDQNIKVGRTANLTLYADTHTRGSYVCRASVEGYPTIEAIVHLFIKGPPKILSNQTQYGSHGDTTKIECAAFSVPKLDSIVWTFDGRDIDTFHDQDFAFQEDILQGGIVNSTLIIRESQSKHFGTYRCNVTNEYGSDIMEIVLKPNRSFPLLFILFGITMSTMVVATLIMLVIICHRKQRNNKQNRTPKKPDVTVTAEELYKENDRNSNISDLKLELRQANGNCEIDYSNTGSDSTLCSNAKLGSGVPLAGSVGMSSINKGYQAYRYNNDYADPAFVDYKPNGYSSGYETFVHYGQEYNPGSLRVQSPNSSDKLTPNRSINGSLPRSADSASTVMMIQGNGSQNNSLQRPLGKKRNGSIADMNNIGVAANDVNRIANGCLISGVDVRYAATYGNPHLRAGGGLTFPAQVNTAKPASTPAPPPYSSVRNSVILPTGQSSHSITSPTSVASPQCAMSPITTSTVSADSTQQQMGIPTSSATPQSPSGHYIVAPSSRTLSNASVTRKGNFHQTPLATHV